jgi:very-short-patch-repair endonuclease
LSGRTGDRPPTTQPIDRFIVDFVCYPKRLIVEVDGIQHADDPKVQ